MLEAHGAGAVLKIGNLSQCPVLCRSDDLTLLLTRETVKDQPQYYIKHISPHTNGSSPPDRLLSNFPHPYPSIRDLQREVIRYCTSTQIVRCRSLHHPQAQEPDVHMKHSTHLLQVCKDAVQFAHLLPLMSRHKQKSLIAHRFFNAVYYS